MSRKYAYKARSAFLAKSPGCILTGGLYGRFISSDDDVVWVEVLRELLFPLLNVSTL